MNVETTLTHVKDIAARLEESGDEELLGSLRGEVVDLRLLAFSGQIDPRRLMVLYIARGLLNDIWTNVGTDATFGFPEETSDEYGLVMELSRTLGQFVRVGLSIGSDESDCGLSRVLATAVGSYFSLLAAIEAKETLR